MALVPVRGSIGTHTKAGFQAAALAYPEPIDENVYFCGYAFPIPTVQRLLNHTAEETFWSIRLDREDVGSPDRRSAASRHVLLDRDDWRITRNSRSFGFRRIIHSADARGLKRELLEGQESSNWKGPSAIPVPVTPEATLSLVQDKFLFTGDHLAGPDNRGGMIAFRMWRGTLGSNRQNR